MTSLTILNVAVPAPSAGTRTSAPQPGFMRQNIYISDGIFQAVNEQFSQNTATVLDGDGLVALPGFIDIHVHGGAGFDTMEGSQRALDNIRRFQTSHGVTAFCPTTMTAPQPTLLKAIGAVAEWKKSELEAQAGARVLGVHVEGPYISRHYPGAQPVEHIRPPDLREWQELLETGPIALLTLAPEEPGAEDLIRKALGTGVVVVLGHTNATYEECLRAATLGATQATHTYNAMSGLHHRRPGTLGAVLCCDQIDAQLIADNVHVHPAAMKILARCKGTERIILITDAMSAAGLDDGNYTLGGQLVTVAEGECRLSDGTLAGSVLTMEEALKNFMAATGLSLAEAWPTSSLNAARALGLADRLGSIESGHWADLVLLNAELEVAATIVGGQIAHLSTSHKERITTTV